MRHAPLHGIVQLQTGASQNGLISDGGCEGKLYIVMILQVRVTANFIKFQTPDYAFSDFFRFFSSRSLCDFFDFL